MVRDCALDSGSLTTDTEIVRMSHCGRFYFEDRYVKGCVQSCFEDACNAASRISGLTLRLTAIRAIMTGISFSEIINLIPSCLETTTSLVLFSLFSATNVRLMLSKS